MTHAQVSCSTATDWAWWACVELDSFWILPTHHFWHELQNTEGSLSGKFSQGRSQTLQGYIILHWVQMNWLFSVNLNLSSSGVRDIQFEQNLSSHEIQTTDFWFKVHFALHLLQLDLLIFLQCLQIKLNLFSKYSLNFLLLNLVQLKWAFRVC